MISPIFAIWKKDVKALFVQPFFYLLSGFSLLILGLLFVVQLQGFVAQSFQLQAQNQAQALNLYYHFISNYLVVSHYVLFFLICVLGIRLFTEEKRSNTFQIYLVSPMSSWDIVLGKWLVGATSILILLLVSAILPLSLSYFVTFPWSMFFISYLGLFLVLCLYMTVSLLASALTESVVICVILTLVLNLILLLVGGGRELTDIQVLQDLFSYMSLDMHFGNFKRGLLSVGSVTYLASFIGLILAMVERVIESHRWR